MPSFPRAVVPTDNPDASVDSSSPLRLLSLLSLTVLIVIVLFFSVRLFKRTLHLPNLNWLRGKGQGAKGRLGFELLPTSIKAFPTPSPSPYAVAFNLAANSATSLATKPLLRRSPSLDTLPQHSSSRPTSPISPTRRTRTRSPFKLPSLFKSLSESSHRRSKSLGGVPIHNLFPTSTSAPSTPPPPLIDFSISSSSHTTSASSDVGTQRVSFETPRPNPLIPGLPIPLHDDHSSKFINPDGFNLVDYALSPTTSSARVTSPYGQSLIEFADSGMNNAEGDLVELVPLSTALEQKLALAAGTTMHDTLISIPPTTHVEVDVGADALVHLKDPQGPTDQVLVSLELDESSPAVGIDTPLIHTPTAAWSQSWPTWGDPVFPTPSPRSRASPVPLVLFDVEAEDEGKASCLDAAAAHASLELLQEVQDQSLLADPFADPEVDDISVAVEKSDLAEAQDNLSMGSDDAIAVVSSTGTEAEQIEEQEQEPDPEDTWFVEEPRFNWDETEVAGDQEEVQRKVKDELVEVSSEGRLVQEPYVIEEEVEVRHGVVDSKQVNVEDVEKADVYVDDVHKIVHGSLLVEKGDDEAAEDTEETREEDDDEHGEEIRLDAGEDHAETSDLHSTDSDPDLLPLPPILVAPAPRVPTLTPILSVSLPSKRTDSCPPSSSSSPKSPDIPLQTPTPPASPPPLPHFAFSRSRPRSPLTLPPPSPILLSPASDTATVHGSSSSGGGTPVERVQESGALLRVPTPGVRTRPHSRCASPVPGMQDPRPLWSIRAADAPPLGLPAEMHVSAETSPVETSEASGLRVRAGGEVVQGRGQEEEEGEHEDEVPADIAGAEGSDGVEEVDHEEALMAEEEEEEKDLGDSLSEDDEVPPTPLPGSFPEIVSAPLPVPTTAASSSITLAPGVRLRTPRSALDIALAMQLRPGLGPGADPAWMVRFLMSMFGWFALLISGQLE